jgi:hypothetical protein
LSGDPALESVTHKVPDARPSFRTLTSDPVSIVIGLAIAIGVIARLWQFLGHSSLWLDELALAENILGRPLGHLLGKPLAIGQVAPPGFLLVTKLVVAVAGPTDFALRLIPLLGAIAALFLFLPLARRVLPPAAVPVAMVLFALSPPLIRRAAEVKQYSTDVTIAIVISLAAIAWWDRPDPRRAGWLGLAIGILVWFSQPVVFVGGGILGALTLLAALSRRKDVIRSLPIVAVLALPSMAAAVLVAKASMTPEVKEYMADFWVRGFIPRHPGAALSWAWRELPAPFEIEYRLNKVLAAVAALLIPTGWLVLWRRNHVAGLVVAVPILAVLAAAVLHQYPFRHRLVMFTVPFALLALAATIDAIRRMGNRVSPALGALLTVLLLVPAGTAFVIARPVVTVEEAEPALRYVAAHRSPGEPLYVYFTGWLAARRYAMPAGIEASSVTIGECHAFEPEAYRPELAKLAGKSTWVFFTHALTDDRLAIVRYLDSAATRIDSVVIPKHPVEGEPSASAYRYDLSRFIPAAGPSAAKSKNPICVSVGPHRPPRDPWSIADPIN